MEQNRKPKNCVVISAILEKEIDKKHCIFVQIRWKPQSSPTYSGMVEIPAGGVEPYENVYDTLYREVKEETGLEITDVVDDYHSEITENSTHDKNHVFLPFLCQQSLESNGGLPWIGFVFRCTVTSEITMQREEAKDPRWITLDELEDLIENHPEKIFPLQYPVLKQYVSVMKGRVSQIQNRMK